MIPTPDFPPFLQYVRWKSGVILYGDVSVMYIKYSLVPKKIFLRFWPHMGMAAISVMFWFGLMLNVPVNNFSVMLGRSHRFLGFFFFFGGGGVNMSCSRTQHGDPSGARTPDLWIRSPRCYPLGHRAPNLGHVTKNILSAYCG